MAELNNFNAHEVDPAVDFDPIPPGKYIAVITKSEMKPTKAGTGNYLELVFQIIDGEFKNRRQWDRLNLNNPNPKAVEIARAQLSSICRAVGVMTPSDSGELHDLPLQITVKCRKREDTGDIVNEITGYSVIEKAKVITSVASSDTAPWKRQ